MPDSLYSYSNISTRHIAWTVRLASLFVPGVRYTLGQIKPFAQTWQESNQKTFRAKGPLWVVLGDPMAQGVGAFTYTGGWVGQLNQILKSHGKNYRLINLSVSGARVEDVLLTQLPAIEALDLKPDLITVYIGLNNMSRQKYRTNLEADFTELINRLPKNAAIATLPGRPHLISPINKIIRSQAKARGLRLVEMEGVMKPPFKNQLARDFFHPNENGYAVYAKAFAEALNAN